MPPKYPARLPMTMPTRVDAAAATTPTNSEIRTPDTARLKTSRPSSSVPIQYSAPGALAREPMPSVIRIIGRKRRPEYRRQRQHDENHEAGDRGPVVEIQAPVIDHRSAGFLLSAAAAAARRRSPAPATKRGANLTKLCSFLPPNCQRRFTGRSCETDSGVNCPVDDIGNQIDDNDKGGNDNEQSHQQRKIPR